MTFEEVVAARRSVRRFEDRAVPRESVERAIALAVQAPAPHHSAPWRFSLVEEAGAKERLSAAMGDAWRADLARDGVEPERIAAI
nr:nitroreductase family protein [Actinomycetota bacterium]